MSEELASLEFPVGDASKLPTSRSMPVGDIIVIIRGFEHKMTQPGEGSNAVPKRVVEVMLAVDQPEAYKGVMGRHTFWLGSDSDPDAKLPATWVQNGTEYMNLFKQAGVSLGNGIKRAEAEEAAKGQQVGVHTYMKATKRINPKTNEPYPARVTCGSFWKPGSREVKVAEIGVEFGDSPAGAGADASSFASQD